MIWRKSSYSNGATGCVEVGWRKSSYSGATAGCVEIAPMRSRIAVRDSKHPTGPTLAFDQPRWRAFLASV